MKNFNKIVFGLAPDECLIFIGNPNCPECQKGYLILRENTNNGSMFLGCSNFPQCDRTYKNIKILENTIKCNWCGGYMARRSGPYDDFYGCTNFPLCQNILNVKRSKW